MKQVFAYIALCVLLISCARVGSPVGGTKDTIAPKFLRANIDSSRVKVPTNLKELRLYFNEYITLKEVSKNLIISPQIKKIKKILPSTLGNKYILIQWEDSLKANTTYNFNFGNAISDLNEGNILPYFNYAFSTGDKLDDLYISGDIAEAMSLPNNATNDGVTSDKKNLVVGLYKSHEKIDFHQKPYYITKADPDGYFELNYISAGEYYLLAFNDENQNSVFDEGKEEVSFEKEKINITKSISGKKIKVYPSRKKLKYIEAKETIGGVVLLFEGKPNEAQITSVPEKLKNYKVTHSPKSDSLFVWFDATKQNIGQTQSENLKFQYKADTLKGTASIFYKINPKNALTISNTSSNLLPPNKNFEITANMPLENIYPEKWTLKKDSLSIPFSAQISKTNPYKIELKSQFEEGKKYQLVVPKQTVSSYYFSTLNSYQFNFDIDKFENYGSLIVNLLGAKDKKHWLQLLNEKREVKYSSGLTSDTKIKLTELTPSKYYLRLLIDENGNGFWDEADFSAQTFAEPSFIYKKVIEIRPLWENVENWDLAEPTKEERPTEVSTLNKQK